MIPAPRVRLRATLALVILGVLLAAPCHAQIEMLRGGNAPTAAAFDPEQALAASTSST